MKMTRLCTSAGVVARGRDRKVRAASPKRTIVAPLSRKGVAEKRSFSICYYATFQPPFIRGTLSGGRR